MKIKSSIALVEEKRKLLRVSLKENDLKDVPAKLENARSHCLYGNGEEMNTSLSEALRLVEEWKKGETPSLWNIFSPVRWLRLLMLYAAPGFFIRRLEA